MTFAFLQLHFQLAGAAASWALKPTALLGFRFILYASNVATKRYYARVNATHLTYFSTQIFIRDQFKLRVFI